MIEIFGEEILRSLSTVDKNTLLHLLEENQFIFSDPLEGVLLQAKILYHAIKNMQIDIIRFLLNLPLSSDVTFFKLCGHTPLSLAIEEGHQELLPLLLAKTDKNFALHMAVKLNFEKTKNFLLRRCVFKRKLLEFLDI